MGSKKNVFESTNETKTHVSGSLENYDEIDNVPTVAKWKICQFSHFPT